MDKIKLLAASVLGILSAFADRYAAIVLFVILVVALDFITGIIASIVNGEKLSSQKGTVGFWKKVALFAAMAFGFLMDYFIPYMLAYVHVEVPASALFGVFIGCYIVVNESLSICENLYRCNDEILPKWVVKVLTDSKEAINKAGDDPKVEAVQPDDENLSEE